MAMRNGFEFFDLRPGDKVTTFLFGGEDTVAEVGIFALFRGDGGDGGAEREDFVGT